MINIISEEEKKLKKYKDSVFIILAIQEYLIKRIKSLKPTDKHKDNDKDEYDINEENLLELLFGNEIELQTSLDTNILRFKLNNESNKE